jgi:hypothetical protein
LDFVVFYYYYIRTPISQDRKMTDTADGFTMDELLDEVARLLENHADVPVDAGRLRPSDVHYMKRQKLIEGAIGKGPEAKYSRETVYRVAFIRLLRAAGLTNRWIQQVMGYMEEPEHLETIARVARGDEKLEVMDLMGQPIMPPRPRTSSRPTVARRKARRTPTARALLAAKEIPPEASLSEMVTMKRAELGGGPPPSEEWQRIPIGDQIEIGIRGQLRRRQMEQVAIVGELLRTIVEER